MYRQTSTKSSKKLLKRIKPPYWCNKHFFVLSSHKHYPLVLLHQKEIRRLKQILRVKRLISLPGCGTLNKEICHNSEKGKFDFETIHSEHWLKKRTYSKTEKTLGKIKCRTRNQAKKFMKYRILSTTKSRMAKSTTWSDGRVSLRKFTFFSRIFLNIHPINFPYNFWIY